MSAAPKFPCYGTFQAARSHGCFACCAPLPDSAPEDYGYPAGRGQWAFKCPECECWTWFDVIPQSKGQQA